MRATLRLLASTSSYLTPGAPTGLTGLLTHATPRSTLLYIYSSTLDSLKAVPEHSVYRQSTEALTKHRMSIVESIKPTGLAEWQERVKGLVDKHPEAFRRVKAINSPGDFNIVYREPPPEDHWKTQDQRVNAEYKAKAQLEGPRFEEEVSDRGAMLKRDTVAEMFKKIEVEQEPSLTREQVAEMETQLSAGLVEEVIAVAEGEKKLVETMVQNRVWEDLEVKPPPGQWVYHERKNQ